MLDKFKKLLGAMDTPKVEAVTPAVAETDTDVALSATEENISLVGADMQKLMADFAALTGELATAATALTAMTASYEAAQAALNAITAEKAEMVVKAEAEKFVARKEKVEMAVGKSGKSDALLAATTALDDAAFEAVVSALAGSVDAEAKTGLFTEVGATASADLTKIVEESPEMKILKQKFKRAK